MQSHRSRFRSAFGLIEILVVVLIIGILAAVLLPRYLTGGKDPNTGKKILAPKERAQQVQGISYLSQIEQAITMYKMDNDDRFPAALSELKRYGVTDSMLLDPVTKQPIGYDPTTGRIWNPTAPNSVNRAVNLPNQNPPQ